MKFELTVLGSSGGPIDGKTCAFLLRPSTVSFEDIMDRQLDDCLISLDAGTGMSGLCEALTLQRLKHALKSSDIALLSYYDDALPLAEYTCLPTVQPFPDSVSPMGLYEYTSKLFNLISAYVITHSHIDHMSGLLVNSPVFSQPVSSSDVAPRRVSLTSSKRVFSIASAIDSIDAHLYNDKVWPDLTSAYTGSSVSLLKLQPGVLTNLNKWFAVETFIVSHGVIPSDQNRMYESSAYIVTMTDPGSHISRKLLVFGDVESDLTSVNPQNRHVWRTVAPLILDKSLSGIVIECSNCNMPDTVPLFGHMTPVNLIGEFLHLRESCMKLNPTIANPLQGMNIIITHVKEIDSPKDPRKVVLRQLQELNDFNRLGLQFTIALPGLTYSI